MYTAKGATISNCGTYRYRLWREWRQGNGKSRWKAYGPEIITFVMLNPSTADGEQDDPTILKCVKFAKRFGYDRMEVINLFAYRATKPQHLLRLTHDDDPVGPENSQEFSRTAFDSMTTMLIAAWGMHGRHLGQDETAIGWLADRKLHALGFTQEGMPKHPLYLPDASPLLPYNPTVRR